MKKLYAAISWAFIGLFLAVFLAARLLLLSWVIADPTRLQAPYALITLALGAGVMWFLHVRAYTLPDSLHKDFQATALETTAAFLSLGVFLSFVPDGLDHTYGGVLGGVSIVVAGYAAWSISGLLQHFALGLPVIYSPADRITAWRKRRKQKHLRRANRILAAGGLTNPREGTQKVSPPTQPSEPPSSAQ